MYSGHWEKFEDVKDIEELREAMNSYLFYNCWFSFILEGMYLIKVWSFLKILI